MAIATILDFFGFAAVGFVLMAAVGIQALVAMFSSVPLTRRHVKECPEFDSRRAYRRIVQIVAGTCILVGAASALIVYFASTASILGFLLGMVLAFVMDIKRMCPYNEQNRKCYEGTYADCYPRSSSPLSGWTAAWRGFWAPLEQQADSKEPR